MKRSTKNSLQQRSGLAHLLKVSHEIYKYVQMNCRKSLQTESGIMVSHRSNLMLGDQGWYRKGDPSHSLSPHKHLNTGTHCQICGYKGLDVKKQTKKRKILWTVILFVLDVI